MKTIKKLFSIALCLALVISFVPMTALNVSAAAADLTVTIDTGASVTLKDTDGDDYYEIGTADELYAFAIAVNGGNNTIKGELSADINVNTGVLVNEELASDTTDFREWTPIGTESTNYSGSFNGNGKIISGLYCNKSDVDYVGLIGYGKAVVQNVNIKDSYFCGKNNVGGIVGYTTKQIKNCSSDSIVCGNEGVGGVVGYVYNTTISGNSNYGIVEGSNFVGGIVGAVYQKCQINDSVNNGTVTGTTNVGGVVGKTIPTQANNITITNASNKGNIKGSSNIGGIAGSLGCYNTTINAGISSITNADNTGKIEGGDQVGGIVGNGEYGACVSMSYNTGAISGGSNVGGIVGKNDSVYYRIIIAEILNCYNTGTVTGTGECIGGIVGSTFGETVGCYNIGDVTGGNTVGAIAGYISMKNSYQRLEYCYYDTDKCSEADAVGGLYSSDQWYSAYGYSTEIFKSGMVAYNLSSCGSWGQNIDNGKEMQEYPSFDGGAVYLLKSGNYTNFTPATQNESGYYEINNASQLMWFAKFVNVCDKSANAILVADIDMTEIAWTPICSTALYYSSDYASGEYPDAGYAGTFNGDGFVIKNLSVTGSTTADVSFGLFGTVSGTVKNLGMENFTYTGAGKDTRVGSIVGQLIGGTVENCYAVGSNINTQVNTTNGVAGGLVGANYGGTVANCYVYNLTMKAGRSGGVVGDNRADTEGDRLGTMTNCYTNYGNYVGSYTGTQTDCGIRAESQFASGEVTYLLGSAWGQGTLPVLRGGETVYENICGGDIFYSTTDGDFDSHDIGSDYRCTNCGNYEPAILVTADNCSDLGLDESYVGYYAIKNASNLYWYSERERIGDISGNIVLLNDITLDNSKAEWIPIGWDGDCTFDGRGNTITLKLNYGTEQDSASYGLFGTCNYCVVKNLFLDGYLTVNTTGNVGAVAASMYRTTISGVISTVNVTNTCTTGGNVGGLVGYFGGQHDTTNNQYSKIENSAVYADVTGYNAGGLIGQSWNGNQYYDITNAAYVGNVTTTDTTNGLAGAIVGYQATDNYTSTFTNIYWCEEDGLGFYGKRDTENQVYTNTEAKTADQFASGEVAYLLQSGNTEQAWGQDNNQAGAKPMFTSNELYKVVKVGETGNYSVANVGDTNGDGIVDITDYQAIVNEIISGGHSQSETESYNDIVKYDLNGDGYVDALDASVMHLFIKGNGMVAVYAVGDYDLNGVAFEETDLSAIKHAIENPEKLSTAEKYACDINGDGKVSEEDLTALTSVYGEIDSETHAFLGGKCKICGIAQLNIADISQTVYFNDNDNKLDLSTLFTLPEGAGAVTYELISGSGTLDGSTLNIVLQGTEKIKVTVAETENYSGDEFEITVTVEAPKGSGSFEGEWVPIGS